MPEVIEEESLAEPDPVVHQRPFSLTYEVVPSGTKRGKNKTTAAVCISRRALKGKKYLFRDIHNDFIGQGHYSKGNGQIKVRP